MKGIAFCALQPVSAKAAVVFHMPDYRFDGAASPNIAFQPRGNAAPEFAVIDLDPSRDSCAAITQVYEHFLRLLLRQDCRLLQSQVQGMTIVRIARQAAHASCRVCGCLAAAA